MGVAEREPWSGGLDEQVIVVAHELSPGLTVQLDREHVIGLVSEEGTRTSHAAILAHSLGIPAVMGVAGALHAVEDGQMVLLDGRSGLVIIDPSRAELEEAKTRLHRRHRLDLQLEAGISAPAITPDGRRLTLRGNVDLPEEIESAVRHGAEGVGLLRTEFLLTGRAAVPTEYGTGGLLPPGRAGLSARCRSSSAPSTSVATSSRPPSRPRTRPTRSSAGARSGCASTIRRCSARSSGPSCAPRWGGTSASCSR